MININIDKAKNIWRNKIRNDRSKEMSRLDIQYMRALEANNIELQQSIAAKKQALRDAPADPRIENASTPEELKSLDLVNEIINNGE